MKDLYVFRPRKRRAAIYINTVGSWFSYEEDSDGLPAPEIAEAMHAAGREFFRRMRRIWGFYEPIPGPDSAGDIPMEVSR